MFIPGDSDPYIENQKAKNKKPQNQPRQKSGAINSNPKPPVKNENESHRGRIQAQGNRIEKSEPWAQATPLTLIQGRLKLTTLWQSLSPAEQRNRNYAFIAADKWMSKVSTYGGVQAIMKVSFLEIDYRKSGKDQISDPDHTRVDIEVLKGQAFVPVK